MRSISPYTTFLFLILCSFGFRITCTAQVSTDQQGYFPIDFDHIEQLADLDKRMIPLDSIISISLGNSPYIKQDSAASARMKYLVKVTRWSVLNDAQLIYQFSQGDQSIIFPGVSGNNQNVFNGYRYGINIGFPLGTLFTLPNQIKAAKAGHSAALYKKDQSAMEVRRQVINEYTKLITAQRVLRIRGASKENAQINFQLAEKKYKEAAIGLEEMARINDQTAESETRYEVARGEFINLFLQFEYLVGVPFKSLLKGQ